MNPLSAEGSVELNKIRLRNYESYYQDLIAYRLEDGIADFSSRYAFTMGQDGPKVKLSELNLALASVRLRKPGEQEDFLRSRSIQVGNAAVDVDNLALSVGQLIFRDGLLNLIRGSDGVLNAARLLPAPKTGSTKGRQGNPWLITLQQAQVEKWTIAFTDLTNKQPVKIVMEDLRFSASGLTNRKEAKGKVTLQGKINGTGAIKISGPIALNPVDAQLDIESSESVCCRSSRISPIRSTYWSAVETSRPKARVISRSLRKSR